MEISVNLSTRFPHILSSPSRSSFSSVSSLPASTTLRDSAISASTTTTIVVKEKTPATTIKPRRIYKPNSYVSRNSAVLQVQQSSDLTSSLQRSSFSGISHNAHFFYQSFFCFVTCYLMSEWWILNALVYLFSLFDVLHCWHGEGC